MNDDDLFDPKYAQCFDFLIECLQQWRRGFWMQHRARMRLKRDYRWHRADRTRAFDHRLHDELMAEMQAVEHAEGQHARPRDVGVICSVKKSHQFGVPPSGGSLLIKYGRLKAGLRTVSLITYGQSIISP